MNPIGALKNSLFSRKKTTQEESKNGEIGDRPSIPTAARTASLSIFSRSKRALDTCKICRREVTLLPTPFFHTTDNGSEHRFHSQCINNWIQQVKSIQCPTCRMDFPLKNLHQVMPTLSDEARGELIQTTIQNGTLDDVHSLLPFISKWEHVFSIRIAISNGNLELTKVLLDNRPISAGIRKQALAIAIDFGHSEIAQVLLANGSISEKALEGFVCELVEKENLGMLEVFLIDESICELAIIEALETSKLEIVQFVLAKGPISRHRHEFAIISAVDLRQLRIVKVLLANVGSIRELDHTSFVRTALIEAAMKGYFGLVQALVADEAILEATRVRILTAAADERMAADDRIVEMVRAVVADGPLSEGMRGTMLCQAARAGRLDVIQAILEYGNIPISDYESAFIDAAEEGHLGIVQFLLANGPISMDALDKGLFLAHKNRDVAMVGALQGDLRKEAFRALHSRGELR